MPPERTYGHRHRWTPLNFRSRRCRAITAISAISSIRGGMPPPIHPNSSQGHPNFIPSLIPRSSQGHPNLIPTSCRPPWPFATLCRAGRGSHPRNADTRHDAGCVKKPQILSAIQLLPPNFAARSRTNLLRKLSYTRFSPCQAIFPLAAEKATITQPVRKSHR